MIDERRQVGFLGIPASHAHHEGTGRSRGIQRMVRAMEEYSLLNDST